MEYNDTVYDHEITVDADNTWYRPTEVNYLISYSKTFRQLQKIRTIGYLCTSNGYYYIQNLDSVFGSTKCQIQLMIDNLDLIPPLSPPQPVQIFGEVFRLKAVFRGNDIDTHSDEIESQVSNIENTSREMLRIKAKVIQYVPPSIIHQMNEIVKASAKYKC